jgi:hypothetical protein
VLPLVTVWVWVLDATVAVVGDDSVTVWVWVLDATDAVAVGARV